MTGDVDKWWLVLRFRVQRFHEARGAGTAAKRQLAAAQGGEELLLYDIF